MAESTTTTTPTTAEQPVVVKKYANRRLYNTETSSYITLDNLADMIRAGRDFVVYDAKSAEDITRGVLTQIIVEEESKGSSMLPTAFLRQLIGFYGDSLQGVVPRYLEQAMSSFARQQQQMRDVMQQTFSPFLPVGVGELGRQNLAMIERAMSMFNPFVPRAETPAPGSDQSAPVPQDLGQADLGQADLGQADLGQVGAAAPAAGAVELDRLRAEVESLRHQLAVAHAQAVVPAMPAMTPTGAPSGAENVLADMPAGADRLRGSRKLPRNKPA